MHRTLVILGFMLATTAGFSQSAKKPLSDAALDKVTAAGVSATVTNGVVKFQGEVPTPNGLVTSTGTLAVQTAPAGSTNLSSLTLSGNAQQNLNSLININAVNSKTPSSTQLETLATVKLKTGSSKKKSRMGRTPTTTTTARSGAPSTPT